MKKIYQEIKWTYYDIMRVLWEKYHRFILHQGKRGLQIWLCRHQNPFYVLTPRLLDEQVYSASNVDL